MSPPHMYNVQYNGTSYVNGVRNTPAIPAYPKNDHQCSMLSFDPVCPLSMSPPLLYTTFEHGPYLWMLPLMLPLRLGA